MRPLLLAALVLAASQFQAQQVDWLASWPVGYTLNPGMPDQALASSPGHLVGMRSVDVELVYGSTVYGSVALDALDPASGATWLSCLFQDSVSVGAAVVDPIGIAYFTGRFLGDVLEACDGSQLAGLGGFLTVNHFLLAWNLNTGMPLWMRNLSLTHGDAVEVPSLAIDPDGHLWYAVEEWGNGKVVRVDAAGDDVETRLIDNVRRIGTISFDPWGGLYVSGACEPGNFTFGGQAFLDAGTSGYSMFVLRYRPDGTAGFVEFAEDATFTNPTVVATNDGHAYLAGDLFLNGTNWGGISFHGPNWVYDTFLTRLDSTGQFLWGMESAPASGTITGDMFRSKGPCVEVDDAGNACLMGTLRGLVDWGNGVVSDGLTLGTQTISIISFAPDGTPLWARTSQPSGFVLSQTLTTHAQSGKLHFAGHLTSIFTFPPETTNIGGAQAAMVGRIDGLSTGVPEVVSASDLLLWPNPAADVLYLELPGTTTLPAELLNSVGQRVRSITLVPGRNAIGVDGLTPGLYLLRGAEGVMGRVVVE